MQKLFGKARAFNYKLCLYNGPKKKAIFVWQGLQYSQGDATQ